MALNFPANPVVGQPSGTYEYTAPDGTTVIYTWDGEKWTAKVDGAASGEVPSGESGDRPGAPTPGSLFYDTTLDKLLYWDGSQWVAVGQVTKIVAGEGITITPGSGIGEVTINADAPVNPPGDTEPGAPEHGDLWVDTSVCPPVLRIYIDEAECPGEGGWNEIEGGGGGTTAVPPVVDAVTLTATGDGSARFTNQTFKADLTFLQDGNPLPENSFNAWVEGDASGGVPDTTSGVYSTFDYSGSGAERDIVNGIDLQGKGGLVWIKSKTDTSDHQLFDTKRGVYQKLETSNNLASATNDRALTAFNNNGFSLKHHSTVNGSGQDYVAWSFAEAPGFFTTVKYPGADNNQAIPHDLGTTPGFMIVKRYTDAEDWCCFHNSFSDGERIILNSANGKGNSSNTFPQAPTDTELYVGNSVAVNATGDLYVAYLFADTPGLIKCGQATADGSGIIDITGMGFEPQWIMYKNIDDAEGWTMTDTERGWTSTTSERLYANLSNAESQQGYTDLGPNADGCKLKVSLVHANQNYIYVAIAKPTTTTLAEARAVKRYLEFDNNGNVTGVSDTAGTDLKTYTNSATFTFGAATGAGTAWDTELPDGTTIQVGAFSDNTSAGGGRSPNTGYIESDPLQPEDPGGGVPDSTAGVFKSQTYTGNDTNRDIVNGVNLADKGGLVWIKERQPQGYNHQLTDTVRGPNMALTPDRTNQENDIGPYGGGVTAFNSNGFSLGTYSRYNGADQSTFVSWTVAKAQGFFDIVTWTGDSLSGKTVPHNLQATPGAAFIKITDASFDWVAWHKNLGANEYLVLNENSAAAQDTQRVQAVSDTTLTLGDDITVNGGGQNYVAYLFGDTPGLIKCGSYTPTGGATFVDCGFDPAWVMIKSADTTEHWAITDNARGDNLILSPNTNGTEITSTNYVTLTTNGFSVGQTGIVGDNGVKYIYVAIAKPTTRSMTEAELNEFKLRTETLDYRTEVYRQDLLERGQELSQRLLANGFAADDVNELI